MSTKEAVITIRVTEEIREKIHFVSDKDDRTMSKIVERFIKKGLQEWEDENGPIVAREPQL